jgi:succinoglycan biosynthesis transport protein ExoP
LTQHDGDAGEAGSQAMVRNEAENIAIEALARTADPSFLWMVFRRRLWVFLLVIFVIMGAVVGYAKLTPERYTATSSILIEPRRGDPIQSRETAPLEQAPSSDYIETQVLMLGSPSLSAAVVRALDLTEDGEFRGSVDSSTVGIKETNEQAQRRETATAEALSHAVTIRRVGLTSAIEIDAKSRSATQAARIADEYAKQYLASLAKAKAAEDARASALIDSRLDELRHEAEQADAYLQNFKITNGLMSSQGATMAEQETSSLNQQIAAARASLAERQGRLAAARSQLAKGGGGGDVTSALNSGTIGSLRIQEAESSRNLAQLSARYGALHPSIAQEKRRLTDIQRQIQLEIDRILTSLAGEVNVAASGLNSLLGSQSQSRIRLAGNASAQVGFMELERKATAARTIYEAFLNRSKGTAARDGIEQPRASIGSSAIIPLVPSSPNTRLAFAVGAVCALFFGVIAIALAEFFDAGMRTKQDVQRRLGMRYLGAIPELSSTLGRVRNTESPENYIVSHPLSSFAEALRGLRASVTLRGNRRPNIIAITSALPREGKTTTSVCLARTLAMAGCSTVLVDCDLRRHSASNILLGERPGKLLDVLAGDLPVSLALLKDTETELFILGTLESPRDGRDLLADGSLTTLLKALRERFDFVILDTPPVLGIAEARIVASKADAVVLVARWRETSVRATDAALDLLLGSQAKIAGVALTMVDIQQYASTGSEDVYGYYGKFKGYYVN